MLKFTKFGGFGCAFSGTVDDVGNDVTVAKRRRLSRSPPLYSLPVWCTVTRSLSENETSTSYANRDAFEDYREWDEHLASPGYQAHLGD